MHGWYVPFLGTVRDYFAFRPFIGATMDLAVNDLGLNRMVIEMTPGIENSSADCQFQYLNGVSGEAGFLQNCAYTPVNDNNDPNVANPSGFHFVLLDWQIDNLVLPMKQRVEARGEKLYFQVRYIDFRASAFEHNQNPAEYAELILAVFEHIRSKYGFAPDGFDLINEPDLANGWSDPGMIGRLAAAAGRRLEAAGFRPDFSAPSTTNKGAAVPYFDGIVGQAGARDYIKELSWHCYADSGSGSAASIAARSVEFGVRTVQSECWTTGNTYQGLLQDLKNSRNAVWGMGPLNANNGYYSVSANGDIALRDRAKYFRQYYKYVRAGARRITARPSSDALDPVAFINTDGRYVVVVKAAAAGSFTITNLPAGTYGIYSTTGPDASTVTAFDVTAPDQTVGASGQLTTSIQGTGVITVFAKTRPSNALSSGSDTVTSLQPPPSDGGGSAAPAPVPADAARTTFVTTDGVRLRLHWVDGELREPVDLALSGDQRVFVAERTRIVVVDDGAVLEPAGLTLVDAGDEGQEELQSLALDPQFDRNHFVYTMSTVGVAARTFRVSRYVELENRLVNRVVLLEGVPAEPDARASIRFAPDGALLAAFDRGGQGDADGDAASYSGKVLRLNPDGTTPRDQTFGTPLFARGFHSPRGLGWEPSSGVLWVVDHDAQGELDLLDAGARGAGSVLARYRLPADLEPSSLAVYPAGIVPLFEDNVLVASDEGRELLRLTPDVRDRRQAPRAERLLAGELGGIRAVAVSLSGAIYIATEWALGVLVPQP